MNNNLSETELKLQKSSPGQARGDEDLFTYHPSLTPEVRAVIDIVALSDDGLGDLDELWDKCFPVGLPLGIDPFDAYQILVRAASTEGISHVRNGSHLTDPHFDEFGE